MAATGEMRIIDRSGDTKIIWDKDVQAEVDAARATFDRLKGERYVAYSVSAKGDKDEVIREFDPDAEKLIMAPPLVGG